MIMDIPVAFQDILPLDYKIPVVYSGFSYNRSVLQYGKNKVQPGGLYDNSDLIKKIAEILNRGTLTDVINGLLDIPLGDLIKLGSENLLMLVTFTDRKVLLTNMVRVGNIDLLRYFHQKSEEQINIHGEFPTDDGKVFTWLLEHNYYNPLFIVGNSCEIGQRDISSIVRNMIQKSTRYILEYMNYLLNVRKNNKEVAIFDRLLHVLAVECLLRCDIVNMENYKIITNILNNCQSLYDVDVKALSEKQYGAFIHKKYYYQRDPVLPHEEKWCRLALPYLVKFKIDIKLPMEFQADFINKKYYDPQSIMKIGRSLIPSDIMMFNMDFIWAYFDTIFDIDPQIDITDICNIKCVDIAQPKNTIISYVMGILNILCKYNRLDLIKRFLTYQ
jgi:hypothetical protein